MRAPGESRRERPLPTSCAVQNCPRFPHTLDDVSSGRLRQKVHAAHATAATKNSMRRNDVNLDELLIMTGCLSVR